mmetsp:Transcript_41299/g.114802  ORF Transcript_41299/g.114802 Transcript_41299/m.114802 type:complete len:351 (-) Transcript_41299:1018-2070(-)
MSILKGTLGCASPKERSKAGDTAACVSALANFRELTTHSRRMEPVSTLNVRWTTCGLSGGGSATGKGCEEADAVPPSSGTQVKRLEGSYEYGSSVAVRLICNRPGIGGQPAATVVTGRPLGSSSSSSSSSRRPCCWRSSCWPAPALQASLGSSASSCGATSSCRSRQCAGAVVVRSRGCARWGSSTSRKVFFTTTFGPSPRRPSSALEEPAAACAPAAGAPGPGGAAAAAAEADRMGALQGSTSRQMAKVAPSSSTAAPKSQRAWSLGKPQAPTSSKLWQTGPRSGCLLAPLPTAMRNFTSGTASGTSSAHTSSTQPLPRVSLKDAPPRALPPELVPSSGQSLSLKGTLG